MNRILRVEYNGQTVGRLDEGDVNRPAFTYAESWLKNPEAFAISASMPLQAEPFTDRRPEAFFGGLLPEGEARERLASWLGISEKNDFSFLDKIGGDCAGALSLVNEGTEAAPEPKAREALSPTALERLIAELPQFPLLTAAGVQRRLSLAGAQTKLALVYEHGTYYLPQSDEPTTHIIKTPTKTYSDLAFNELFCTRLASFAGINVVAIEPDRAGQQLFLRIERYDRHFDAKGKMLRIHQEDFCQASGIVAGNKYQVEGGPGLLDCVRLIRDLSTYWSVDLEHFLRLLAFNYFIGNCDAHGKNFAFLRHAGNVKMTPAYDLVSTAVYPGLSHHMAMKIGGQTDAALVTREHWRVLAKELGVAEKHILGVLENVAFHLNAGLPAVTATLEQQGWTSPIYAKIRDHIQARIAHFREGS